MRQKEGKREQVHVLDCSSYISVGVDIIDKSEVIDEGFYAVVEVVE